MARRSKPEVTSLFYICHVDNLASILRYGILSHDEIENRGLSFVRIYDSAIVSNRQTKTAPDGNSLWKFANVYFQPRNPMLYRVLHEVGADKLAVIGVRPEVADTPGAFIADGNAANNATEILASSEGLKRVQQDWNTIQSEWWNPLDGSKRRIMAECLVPQEIPAHCIHSVFVTNHAVANQVRSMLSRADVNVIPEPQMFFRPIQRHRITNQLSLAEGDMFFSQMQTLTVSVNTVGVMGKGVASRAKYQFPDVYVKYQDACRTKRLAMGKPYLYKREASLDEELLDQPSEVTLVNAIKWFLLFPTKNHWRNDSDRDGIEAGLNWLIKHQSKNRIESLALPALGCGLGNLTWQDIGPLMCQKLTQLEIPVTIYLPRERQLDRSVLSSEFLLGIQTG